MRTVRTGPAVRVGMVCPYSLSLPGGVQGQVLGIARAMRKMGVEARVLAPCDGPPPESWITPLGASVPAAGNGSIAPIAPDPSAALRTIRALRDERFDIVHLHEPFVPGPTMTALLFSDGPLVGTFHRAGAIAWYRAMRGPGRWAAKRLALRCAVSTLALETARDAFGGSYELLWNGIDVGEVSAADPWPTAGPTILFLGRHEPRKGLAVLIEAVVRYGVEARVWVASEGPQTASLKELTLGDARFEWLGPISEEEKLRRLARCGRVGGPFAARRKFRHRPARGHGGRRRRGGQHDPRLCKCRPPVQRRPVGPTRRRRLPGDGATRGTGRRAGNKNDARVRLRTGI